MKIFHLNSNTVGFYSLATLREMIHCPFDLLWLICFELKLNCNIVDKSNT